MAGDADTAEVRALRCPNCSAELVGRFCANCGQDSRGPPSKIVPLAGLLLSYLIGIEGTALRTVRTLLFLPGRLTRDYVSGRRARYANPVQVYVWCTAMFFMLHAYAPLIHLEPDTRVVSSSLSVVTVNTHLSPQVMQRAVDRAGSLDRFESHFDNMVTATLPVMLIILVAASALLLRMLFWRAEALTHITFALHWSAFYFTLETARQIAVNVFGSLGSATSLAGSAIIWIYLSVAMYVVYQCSWWRSILSATVAILIFPALLGTWLWSTSELARLLA